MDDLHKMKYAELQKLAKKAGIRANAKHEKLVLELKKYYARKAAKKSLPGTPKVRSVAAISTPGQTCRPVTPKPNTPRRDSPAINKHLAIVTRPAIPHKNSPVNLKSPVVARKPGTPCRDSPAVISSPVITPKPGTPCGNVVEVGQHGTPTNKSASRWTKKVMTPVRTPGSASKRKNTDMSVTPQPAAKKRRSTFEAVATPELTAPAVVDPSTGSKQRRSTFEKVPTPNLSSPDVSGGSSRRRSSRGSGVGDMLGAMKGDMTDQQMKDSLMTAIDKKVADKGKVSAPLSNIPRFAAFLKKRDELKKPVTPGNKDWNRIHKKNFAKFDSIDVYLEKKRRRAEEITTSVKKAKLILGEVHTAVDKLRSHRTPQCNDENKFKPKRGSLANRTTPFKPSVTNTSKMDLNFGVKKTPKTQPRVSMKPVLGSEVKRTVSHTQARKSAGSALARKSINTPFKFTAVNTTNLNQTVASTKKFDLKASLARPLTWKPHAGKLKPLIDDSPAFKKVTSVVKSKNTRVNRRANMAQSRADKKLTAQMARRGINT